MKLTHIISKKHKQFIKSNKSVLKTKQRFKSGRHNAFNEEINKIALSSDDDKRTQPIDSKETYPYGTSKDLASEKKGIKWSNIIKWLKKRLTLIML